MEDIYRFFNYQVELGQVSCGFKELLLLDSSDPMEREKPRSGLPSSGKDARSTGAIAPALPGLPLCAGTVSADSKVNPSDTGRDSTSLSGSPSLVLKRGLCPAKDLAGWWERARNGRAETRDVSVILLDEKKKPAAAWYFFNARPVDLKAPVYEGREEELPVEELVLSFDAVKTSVLGSRR